MRKYAVVIERADDGSFSAYVPDLPGCHGGGETPEAAIARRRLGGSRMGRA